MVAVVGALLLIAVFALGYFVGASAQLGNELRWLEERLAALEGTTP